MKKTMHKEKKSTKRQHPQETKIPVNTTKNKGEKPPEKNRDHKLLAEAAEGNQSRTLIKLNSGVVN